MPTNTYTMASGLDDYMLATGSNGPTDPYPPIGAVAPGDNDWNWTTNEFHVTLGYTVRVCLVRWDTSDLPSREKLVAAKLRVFLQLEAAVDGKKLVGESYAFTRVSADYTHFVGNGAINGFTVQNAVRNGTFVDIPIDDLDTINVDGFTSYRLGMEAGAPSNANYFIFSAYEDAAVGTEPQLIVDFDTTPPANPTGLTATLLGG